MNRKRYAVCAVSAAPVRKEASHRSEMVNQLVYGEGVEVLEKEEEWLRIQSIYDGYQGWVTFHLLQETNEDMATVDDVNYTIDLLGVFELKSGGKMYLPMGSVIRQSARNLYEGKISETRKGDRQAIIHTAKQWLHAPYLWGGKTAMGVDCSGFVQTVFKVHGYVLLRDAFQQATQGREIALHEAKAGDIAFFNNEAGRITHVGILINNYTIIHAAGKVRIDAIDNNGIQNETLKKQTHSLHSVRTLYES